MKTAEELRKINENRVIDQICFVTDNYKKTIEYFTEKLDIGPWSIKINSNKSAHDVKMNGEKVTEPFSFYVAHAKVGNLFIEVIQPEYGPNPYSEFLKEKGPGIHHIKESIYSGAHNLQKFMDDQESKGHCINYEGCYMEDIYYYIDTNSALGAYYEIGNSADISEHPLPVEYYPEKWEE